MPESRLFTFQRNLTRPDRPVSLIYLRFSASAHFKYIFNSQKSSKYSMIYECPGLAGVVPAPDMELIVERDDPPTIIR